MDEHEAPHMPAIPEKLEATRLQAYEERAAVPEARSSSRKSNT